MSIVSNEHTGYKRRFPCGNIHGDGRFGVEMSIGIVRLLIAFNRQGKGIVQILD